MAAEWIDPIASWAHADDLTRLYSSALAAAPVIPVLRTWSLARDQ